MTYLIFNRKDESGPVPFRSGRFYSVGDDWYFAVRRGEDKGPYPSRQAARSALAEYINQQLEFEKSLQDTQKHAETGHTPAPSLHKTGL